MVIIEKPAKGAGARATAYARTLASYMHTAKRNLLAQEHGLVLAGYMRAEKTKAVDEEKGERVLACGASMGGQIVAWEVAMAEMEARLAKRSSRSKKPVRHIIASYRVGEQPDAEGCADVVATLGDELGCETGLFLWALHGDTDNAHLHILALTLDGQGAATPYGPQGKSYEAMQRAIARLEHAQQLTPEVGSRYEADDRGVRRRSPVAKTPVKRRAPIRTEVLQAEAETGVESFTRYAQDVLADHLDQATSWEEAQVRLARQGATVLKKGSGGEIRSGDGLHKVMLSNVDRKLSWAELTKRWGEWSEPNIKVAPYQPRILDLEQARSWLERDIPRSAAHGAVQTRIDRLVVERTTALADRKARYTAQRQDIAGLPLSPDLARAMQAALSATSGQHIAETDAAYCSRIAALRELRQEVDDCLVPADIDLPDISAPDCSLVIAWAQVPHRDVDLLGYQAVRVGKATQYWRRDDASRLPAFVERGDRIWMSDMSDEALRAALIVARARYGDVMAFGDEAFIRRAQMLGKQLGIDVEAGVRSGARPPRHRSPRITQRYEVIRAAQARAVERTSRIRRVHVRLLGTLLADEPEAGSSPREELPARPPDRVIGLDEITPRVLIAAGIVVAPVQADDGATDIFQRPSSVVVSQTRRTVPRDNDAHPETNVSKSRVRSADAPAIVETQRIANFRAQSIARDAQQR